MSASAHFYTRWEFWSDPLTAVVAESTGDPTVTEVTGDQIYQWSNNGSITFRAPVEVQYLIVGGGGGAGGADNVFPNASGGGAGGMLTGTFTATEGVYEIIVGRGGNGGGQSGTPKSSKGTDTSIVGNNAPDVAIGGGAGDQQSIDEHTGAQAGREDGGSGGGIWFDNESSRGLGTLGQGNDGGVAGGGGGGAGTEGRNGVNSSNPEDHGGGDGLPSDITGVTVTYAGGGAGRSEPFSGLGGAGGGGDASTVSGVAGGSGTDGLGSGGGAGKASAGGDGGDGIVILRFADVATEDAPRFFGEHKVQFSGIDKIIYVNEGVTTLDVKTDIYSAWKEWNLANREQPNALAWPLAITAIGGQSITDVQSVGSTFFLENGWRIQPFSSGDPYVLTINGNIYTREVGDNPVLFAEGVSVALTRSNLVDLITITPESSVTVADKIEIAQYVWDYLTTNNVVTNSYGETVQEIKTAVEETLKTGEFLALQE